MYTMTELRKKRIIKRQYLLKKLFYSIAYDVLNKKVVKAIKLKVSHDAETCCKCSHDGNYSRFFDVIVIIGVKQIKKDVIKNGLYAYYEGRHEFIGKYLLNNLKLAYRIAILHELFHAKMRLSNKFRGDKDIFEELQADNFAVSYLKNKGMLS